ncbi:MAG: DUF2339 domain-containing protein, partial [Gemmatimonadetes bacterium]|nr:DUF2339 domain-containing protein [Gemmatimonadota bacterium]
MPPDTLFVVASREGRRFRARRAMVATEVGTSYDCRAVLIERGAALEIIGIVVLVVLAVPVGLVWALVRIGKLENSISGLHQEIAALKRREARRAARAAPGAESEAPADRASSAESTAADTPPPGTAPPPGTTPQPGPEAPPAGPPPYTGPATPPPLPGQEPVGAETGPRSKGPGSDGPGSSDEQPDDPTRPTSAAGLDVEAAIGGKWLLRAGLGILAIALALFARLVAPQLSPMAKVALAYAGALGFFALGKFFEDKLDRFAKPVMAGGLAFGFFVAFAAHFVPAMQAVSLPVSIGWMALSMLSVLVAAERWKSESTAVLAIVLGHVSAQVSAGAADIYSLVMIAFLALTALALLLRHGWVQLGLLGVVASYGAHLLWMLADRQAPMGDEGFWLSLAFLTSYYLIFLVADLLWWYREPEVGDGEEAARRLRDARAMGPANLVLYVSLTTFLYLASGAMVESVEWYYLTLGALQAALAWLYRSVSHKDWVFYPVFGTILWTIGLFAALDALVLNLVLASQALLLLITAHRTGLRVFYLLSQAMMAAAFIHYFSYPPPAPGFGPFMGGLAVALVYLVKADLEESWYDVPFLPQIHAVLGGLVVLREVTEYMSETWRWGAFLAAVSIGLTLLVLARGRSTLLFTVSTVAVGLLLATGTVGHDPMWLAAMGSLAAALVLVYQAPRIAAFEGASGPTTHARTIAGFVLLAALFTADGLTGSLTTYLLWMLLPAGVIAVQLELNRATGTTNSPDRLALVIYVAAGVLILVLTGEATTRFMQPAWSWIWASVLFGLFGFFRYKGLTVVGFTVLFGGAFVFLNTSLFAIPAVMGSGHPALSSWVVGAFLAVVPFAIGWRMDLYVDPPKGLTGLEAPNDIEASLPVYMPYLLGLLTVGAVAAELTSVGWVYVAPAVIGTGLAIAGRKKSMVRPVVAAVLGAALWHIHFLFSGATMAPALEAATLLLLGFAVLTLVTERIAHTQLV